MKVDKKNGILVVENFSRFEKDLAFDGSIVAGIGCRFRNLIAKEIIMAKGCVVRYAKAKKIVLGASSIFGVLDCERVILMNNCVGKLLISKLAKIAENCEIEEIRADYLEMSGSSKVKRVFVEKLRLQKC